MHYAWVPLPPLSATKKKVYAFPCNRNAPASLTLIYWATQSFFSELPRPILTCLHVAEHPSQLIHNSQISMCLFPGAPRCFRSLYHRPQARQALLPIVLKTVLSPLDSIIVLHFQKQSTHLHLHYLGH